MPCTREQLAERAARELQDGFYVNLGIGRVIIMAQWRQKTGALLRGALQMKTG